MAFILAGKAAERLNLELNPAHAVNLAATLIKQMIKFAELPEWHGWVAVMRGVIGHLPTQPAHEGVCPGRSGVLQDVGFVGKPQMLNRVL